MPILLMFLLDVFSWWWNAYLGSIMWRWFAVGIFHLRPLTVAQCFVTLLLLMFFMPYIHPVGDDDTAVEKKFAHRMLYGLVEPTVVFVIAWAAKALWL